jgi:hypothetical protein
VCFRAPLSLFPPVRVPLFYEFITSRNVKSGTRGNEPRFPTESFDLGCASVYSRTY